MPSAAHLLHQILAGPMAIEAVVHGPGGHDGARKKQLAIAVGAAIEPIAGLALEAPCAILIGDTEHEQEMRYHLFDRALNLFWAARPTHRENTAMYL
jgi:hypothetical protein